jgi:hypothetical protein
MTQQKKKKKENQEKTGNRILGVLENCSSMSLSRIDQSVL